MRNIEETKTERTLSQFLQRLKIRKKATNKEGDNRATKKGLAAYPYDSSLTVETLLQSKPHYAYGHSLLKAFRFWKKNLQRKKY